MGDLSKNFNRAEFACKCGCGFDVVDTKLLEYVQAIRDHFKRPVTITSACRCDAHNKAVGGKPNSQHRLGRAADLVIDGVAPRAVAEHADSLGCGGVGSYNTFTHIDSRTNSGARW